MYGLSGIDMVNQSGVIGLGEMGTPIVRRWLNAGYDVSGFDVDEEKLHNITEDRKSVV